MYISVNKVVRKCLIEVANLPKGRGAKLKGLKFYKRTKAAWLPKQVFVFSKIYKELINDA